MTNEERLQTHVDAITAQIGPCITPAQLLLAQRLAGLTLLCEVFESGKPGKLKDARNYMSAVKLMRDLSIALGVALNPRTATTGQRAASATDAHAAMVLDED